MESGVKKVTKEYAVKMAAERGETYEVDEEPQIKRRKSSQHNQDPTPTIVEDSDSDGDTFRATLKAHKLSAKLDGSQLTEKSIDAELERYKKYEFEDDIPKPLSWWLEHTRDPRTPFLVLSRMALDLYAVRAMSRQCEWVFSDSTRLITDDRNHLSAATIEATQCQNNSLNNHVVQSTLAQVV